MGIYLLRDGVQQGPFAPDAVGQMLAAAQCHPADLAWQPGVDGWVPLSELLGLPPPPPAAPPGPPSIHRSGLGVVWRRLGVFWVLCALCVGFGALAGVVLQISPDQPGEQQPTVAGCAVLGFLVFLVASVYLAPAVIAFARAHHYRWVIGAINLFAGLTGIGWVATLFWAVWPSKTSFLDPIAGDPTSNSAAAGRQIYSRWGSFARAYSDAAAPPRLPPSR